MTKLLCLGDSLTYGYAVPRGCGWVELTAQKLGWNIDNQGLNGDTTAGMYQRLRHMSLERYDAYFFMGGSNDVLLDIDIAIMEQNVTQILHVFLEQKKTIYLGIPLLQLPESTDFGWQRAADVGRHCRMLVIWRMWLLAQCKKLRLIPIDFFQAMQRKVQTGAVLYADGVHPNEAGYALLAEMAEQVFSKTSSDGKYNKTGAVRE